MNDFPLIIAMTSGKGGVGKTMLSVACAYELSYSSKTLLVDLDFFNRGLSGLFRQPLPSNLSGIDPVAIERPQFLVAEPSDPTAPESQIAKQPWELWKIENNLFHIHFPDTSNREDDALERGSDITRQERVATQANQLGSWLLGLANRFAFKAIVLDCHGGPDMTSFAATFIADYTLLISEPDRITLHGTLNFLRKLWRLCGEEAPDVRLVFNKVVPQFGIRFLVRFYNKTLRREFFEEKLLAVFPLEIYLTKAFEQTPILSKVYPHSLLARKMQLLLRSLLYPSKSRFLRPLTICQSAWLRSFRYYTMGKKVFAYDSSIVLNVITGYCVLLMVAALAIKYANELSRLSGMTAALTWVEGIKRPETIVAITMPLAAGFCWLLAAALWQATVWVDRVGIRATRRSKFLRAILWFVLLAVIWTPGDFMIGAAIHESAVRMNHQLFIFVLPIFLLALWVSVMFGFRSFRQFRYGPRWLEICLQLGLVVSLVVVTIAGFFNA
jgi:MinD-like ATPase involved in chromosome partitioning or flagellar assembly